jgi:hypothetical protein
MINFQTLDLEVYYVLSKGKKKKKLSLWLSKHHSRKNYWGGWWRHSTTHLDLGTRRWVVSFTPWSLYPQYPLIGAQVGSTAGLDTVKKRKIPSPCHELIVQPVASRYTDWATTALLICSVDLSMVPSISGMTHIETIFSFSLGISKHFISNKLCSSDDSVTQLTHYSKQSFTNKSAEEKIKRSQIFRTRGPGNWFPSSYPMMRKLPLQKVIGMTGEVRWCII